MSARSLARRHALVRSMPVFGLSLCAMVPMVTPARAQTLPSGGQIVAGNATIGGTVDAMTIKQSSDKAIINWNDFSIANKASVRIENGKGATLNRVTGTAVSSIDGLLSASGSVYLINKNGIVVGKTGQIDVGGSFVGSTQDMTNAGFLAGGSTTLQGASEAAIVNYGKIGSLGGDVALIAAKVENRGVIDAAQGSVGLLAGYQVILRDQSLDDGKFSVVVGGKDTSVTNTGAIRAAEAELRAQGGNVYALAGNTSGVINAQGVTAKDGRIFLSAGDGGELNVSGALTARKADGQGGAIEATGYNVLLDKGAVLDASGTTGGTVLVGGDWQGGADASLKVVSHDVARSNAVVMAESAKIDVSGSAGKGGMAVLWSNRYTNFAGGIDAYGTTDGGRIETSSKINLQSSGRVDARGGTGRAGDWLLDPSDIIITGSATNGGTITTGTSTPITSIFTPTSATSTVNTADINAALNAGNNVTIATSTTGTTSGSGDITLASGAAISKTSGADATLTLAADRNITLTGAISSNSSGPGKLNVNLNSRASGGASGTIAINNTISTNGGDINAYGGNKGVNGDVAIGTSSEGVTIAGNLNAGGGNISVSGQGSSNGAVVAATVGTTGAGAVSIYGIGSVNPGISASSTGLISTEAGAITLTGTALITGVYLSGASLSSTSGAISVIGNATATSSSSPSNLNAGIVIGTGNYNTAPSITSTSGNIILRGTSAYAQGVYVMGNSTGNTADTISTSGAGSVTIIGTAGGSVVDSNWANAAIGFGYTSSNAAVSLNISAGTGGLTMTGTGPSGTTYGIYGNLPSGLMISSAGGINISGNQAVLLPVTISQTGATGTVDIRSASGALTTGAINLATNNTANIAAASALNTGAITTTGAGDITLISGTNYTAPQITKKAAATGTSTLTIKSAASLNVGNAIATESSPFNINLNSRASGGAAGTIAINNTITSNGGNINAYGGNLGVNGDAAIGTSAIGVLIAKDLNAGGGNVTVLGRANSTSGVVISAATLATSGAGAISISGTSSTNAGVTVGTSSLVSTEAGAMTLTGTASVTGLYIAGGSLSSTSGAISVTGNATGTSAGTNLNSGLALATGNSNTPFSVTSASGNITLRGTSAYAQGVYVLGNSGGSTQDTISTGGAGSVTIIGTGGGNVVDSNWANAAIGFGYTTGNAAVSLNISAGTGGLTMTGTGSSGTAFGIYGNLPSGLMISSAGGINISGSQAVSLPVTISQTGATGTVDIRSLSGALTTGAINLATNNTATFAASAALSTGTITTTGAGDISLVSGASYTSPQITKKAAATGTSTLTIQSAGDLTVANAIATESSPFNINLSSRSGDAANGTVTVNNAITTRAGNVLIRGGSVASGIVADPSQDYNGFVSLMKATGTTFAMGTSGSLATSGGSVEIRSYSTTGNGFNMSTGTLATQGAGNLSIYGLGGTTASAANGLNLTGGTVSTEAGTLRLYGASQLSSNTYGVLIGGASAEAKSNTGNIIVSGAANPAAGPSGSASAIGALISSGKITLGGGSGALTVTGAGGGAAGSSYGVGLLSSIISSASSGLTTINGIGGSGSSTSNFGVYLNGSSATTLVSQTGGGALTVTGRSTGGYGIAQGASGSANLGGTAMTGLLTLRANSMFLNGSGGALRPQTSGALLVTSLAGGSLTVDGNILPALFTGGAENTYGAVQFGSADTTSLTLNTLAGYNTFSRPLALASGSTVSIASGGGGTSLPLTATAGLAFMGGVVTQSTDIRADLLSGNAMALALTRAGNAITALGALNVTGNLGLVNNGALAINGASITGTALIQAKGDLTIGAAGSIRATGTDSTGALQLVTSTKFVNNGGVAALSTPNDRWLVYSQAPENDTVGGLPAAFIQYNAGYLQSTISGAGNGLLYVKAPQLTVSLIGTFKKVYDGTTTAALTQDNFKVDGLLAGDTASVFSIADFDTKNVGTQKTVNVSDMALSTRNGATRIYGYSLKNLTASAVIGEIAAKSLNVSLTGPIAKTYDGLLTASLTNANYLLNGVVGSDVVNLNNPVSGSYDNKNVGYGKTVTVSGLAISGADAANYTVAGSTTGAIGVINQRTISTSAVVNDKVYDGTTVTNGSFGALSNVVAGDTVSVTGGTIAFADRNAGTNKAITVTNAGLIGVDAANYRLAPLVATTANITKKALTLTAAADSKVYDGGVVSNAGVTAVGLAAGDTITATQSFLTKNVGAQTLQVSNWTIGDGNNGGNYTVNLGATASGAITAKTISAAITVGNKVYDATVAATGSVNGLTGVVAGDTVNIDTTNGVLAFADKNAGNGKAVTASGYALSGTDAGNYTLAALANGVANITKAGLVLTAGTDSRTYDGTTGSAGIVTAAGLLGPDRLLSATQAFDSRNVGDRRLQVVANSWTIDDGNAGSNYAVTLAAPTAGSIAAKALTLTAVADTKVYDGTTASAGLVQSLGLVSGDTVNASQIYDSKNAGNRTLQVANGYVVADGNGGANYAVSLSGAAAGAIVAKTIAANATVDNKVYDATTVATGSVNGLTGVVTGDTVSIDTTNGVLAFADKNAGNGKAVTATGYALNGTDASNYMLAALANGVANITRAGLVLTAGTEARTYDGTTGSTGIVTAAGLAGTDRLLSAIQAFDSRNAGDRGLQVVANSWAIEDGNAGGNYAVTLAAPTAGSIAAKALTLTAVADTKVYDGTTASSGLVQSLGLVTGDTVNASQVFDSRNAGSRTLQVTNGYVVGDGNGGANYVVSLGDAVGGSIAAKTINAAVVVDNKVYDATTAATGSINGLTGVVAGDTVNIDTTNGVLAFADKNAGNGKAVTASGYALNGTDAGNYTLAALANGVADIARAGLVLTAGTDARTYDGTTGSTGIVTAAGLHGVDRLLSATQAFDSRNAGDRGLQVVANSWTIDDGNAGSNYAVTLAAPTAGSIAVKALTLTAVADTKVYDGTTASAGLVQSLGLVSGDTVNASQIYDSKNAGNRTLQVANGYVVADGNGGANYAVSFSDVAAGTILAKAIAANATVENKIYDATTAATGSVNGLTGVVAGDTVSIDTTNGVLAFADKNAGNGKAVTATGYALSGADAGNYTLAALANGVANITKAGLVLTAGTDSRTYDGTTGSAGIVTAAGLVGADRLLSATQAFDSRNVGDRGLQVVANSWTIEDGNAGGNYAVTLAAPTAGSIAAKALTLTAVADTKVYDGTTASAGLVQSLGLVSGDTVNASQIYDSKNAGNRTLQVANGYVVADGNGGANYAVSFSDAAAGTILAKTIAANATVANKVYDATTAATGSVNGLTGVVAGDAVNIDTTNGVLAFTDKNAGNGKAVTASGYALSGADAGNYTLAALANGVADIAKAGLLLTAGTDSRTYDGTTGSTGIVTAAGLVGADRLLSATQAFDSRNAGDRGLQVVANSWAIEDGNAGGNYAVTLAAPTAGSIAAKALTLTAVADTKIYDGTTASAGLVQTLGLVSGDTVNASQIYDSKNAGNRTLQVANGYVVGDGNGGANYSVSFGNTAAGIIVAKTIAANATVNNKVYDATLLATGNVDGLTGIVAGDTVNIDTTNGVLMFTDRNAGNGKAIAATGYALNGTDAGNYTLAALANGVANITRAGLVLTAGTDARTYDGTTGSAGIVTAAGLRGADRLLSAAQAFDSRNAGDRGLQVVANSWTIEDGNAGGNYAVTLAAPTAGSIAAKALTLTAVADTKVYDGTTASAGAVQSLGLVSGDTVNASQIYDSKNAGNRTLQVANSYAIADGNGGANYVVSLGNTAAGTITAKTIAANATVGNKVYDATTAAIGRVDGLTGVVVGDAVGIDASNGVLAFADRNAGNGKAITATGYTLSGTDAGNYTLATFANGVANIARASLVLTAGTDARTYDGTTGSTGIVTAAGLVGTDRLLSATQAFDSRNAGDRGLQVVANSWTIEDGNAGGNYAVTLAAPTAGSIAAKALTLAAVADTKVYDGTTASAGAVQALGLVNGDTVNVSQVFDSRNAGNRVLQVANGYVVADGNGGANYVVSLGDAAVGAITAKTVAVDATVNDKVYDGTTTATGTVSGLTGLVQGDAVDVNIGNGVLAFFDKNAGNGKAVLVSGYTLNGTDAGNYILGTLASGVANIAKAGLVLTASSDAKTYDGTTASAGAVTITGLAGSDTATAVQSFDAKNAGNRNLTASSWTINDGNEGGNYAVTRVSADGNITRKELSGSLTGAVSKVYDGTNIAALLGTNLAGVVRGDDLVVSAASTIYEDRNVGTQKLVTVTGMTLAGEDAANYLLLQDNASAAVGMITPRIVSVTTSGRGAKTYDGTTDFVGQTGTLALATAQGDAATAALLAADGVALDTGLMTGVLADRNAGTGKSVDLTGFTLANNAFGNYALASDIVRGVADIARAQLTLSAVGDSKVYNGTTVSDGQVRMTGLVAGDMASATQAFDSWNAGNRSLKVVNYTVDDGNVGANYLVSTLDAGGVIAQRELILQVDNASKVAGAIDPTFTFTVGGAGLVAGDTVSGAATRDAGEAAGAYAIRQGSLSAGANYAMNVVPGRLTIDAATTTPDTGNGGTVPDTGNGGTVPDTGNGGTVPDTGNGGTVPDTGNGGTVPDTGNGGTVPDTGNGGTVPDTGNGGTVPDTGNGGTVPDTGNGGTVPDTGNGGTVPDTGNGGTVPDTGNGGTGNGSAALVRTALAIAEQAVRVLPGTNVVTTTLQPGVGGSFDNSAGFGSQGTTRFPGALRAPVELNSAAVAAQATGAALENPVCAAGSQDSDCKSGGGSGLPYSTNRILTPILRFLAR